MFTQKGHIVRGESQMHSSNLSWVHYRELMRISRSEAISFYEIEAMKNQWSSRELQRQIGSLLFDRLSKKKWVLGLALKGQEVSKFVDATRAICIRFLGIPESHRMVESKLEQALIRKLSL